MLETRAEITLHQEVASHTYLLGLDASEMAQTARPGQFVMLQVRDGPEPLLRRPFSICGTRRREVLLLYRVVGRGTALLAANRVGGRLSVLGPLGRPFTLPAAGETALLIAGGLGVAPLAFLSSVLPPERVRLLTGYRTADEVVPVESLNLTPVTPLVATDDGSAGHRGVVTSLLEDLLNHGTNGPYLFACGPRPMLRHTAALARTHKTACQVSLESQMACGLGACQGCAVPAGPGVERVYLHVCRDGPVFDAAAVDWEHL